MSDALRSSIRRLVAEDLARPDVAGLGGDDRREFARRQVLPTSTNSPALRATDGLPVAPQAVEDEQRLAQEVLDALFGLGRLQSLIDDREHREHRHQRL